MNKGKWHLFQGNRGRKAKFGGEQRQYWGTGNIRNPNLRERGTSQFISEEQGNMYPPHERASHITEATEYHQSNGMQYYSKFAIVIQAMMCKQLLVLSVPLK